MCLAVICFSVLDSTAKYLGEYMGLPIGQVLWARFLVHLTFLFAIYRPKRFTAGLKTNAFKIQILRGFAVIGATAFNFLALQYLQLDQTITIFFLSPLLIAALSGPILGEWLEPKQLLAVIVGFIGVFIVMRPGFGGIHPAVIYSLMATLSLSIYNVMTRYSSHHDSNQTNQIYTPLIGALLFTPFALYSWQTPETLFAWGLLLSLGISGGLGHWLLITAHRHAPAPILAPFIYLGIISMTLIGYFVFDDVASEYTLAGAVCVISSGLYLWYQDRAHKSAQQEKI